ncbi:reverse transcriptase domain-containing protein [Tanacetum coccineum]
MPTYIRTYDGSEYPEDHLKIFQAAAKTKRWAMPTWCHMFNSTLTGNTRIWFDDLPAESIDSYDDLKKAFLENYLQQKKCIKDPIEIHNIKQRNGESTEDFVKRYKLENRDVKGAPECMRISGFMHGITNSELIKGLHDKIPKTIDEMMRVTTSFLMREVAASNHERKKSFPPWKQQEGNQKQNFKKRGFRNQQRPERKQGRFTLLTKTPKEIFALDKGKFKAPLPMTTPVEKQNHAKFCEFHGEVGHNTDEWEDEGTEGPMIIGEEIGGHCIHRMYVDGGSASEILYEHFFSQLRPEIKNQLMPATTPLIKFSVEIIWPIGQIQLLEVPLECATVSEPEGNLPATKQMVEERVKVAINLEYPEQTIMIGSTLTEEGHNKLCDLLQRNLDIFAWKPADMTGVPRHIAEHRLNVREGCSPVRQKKRGQAADRNQAMQEEVVKLVEARIMKEVHYHDWLSNPVMVKKHDDSWRMCVDFKDLNKACPKDGYLLPEIV